MIAFMKFICILGHDSFCRCICVSQGNLLCRPPSFFFFHQRLAAEDKGLWSLDPLIIIFFLLHIFTLQLSLIVFVVFIIEPHPPTRTHIRILGTLWRRPNVTRCQTKWYSRICKWCLESSTLQSAPMQRTQEGRDLHSTLCLRCLIFVSLFSFCTHPPIFLPHPFYILDAANRWIKVPSGR